MLSYTGQLNLEKTSEAKNSFETRYLLVPRPSERIVLLGGIYEGRAEWVSKGDGTYAYFGMTNPVQSEHVVAVVDSGLPKWLLTQTEELLPKLFAFYSEKLGTKLNFKPVVFVSYGEEANPKAKSFGGGTLPGLVQMEVRLPRGFEVESNPDVPVRAGYLIAHESAHLWNHQMFHHEVKGGDWLHQGGADALAWRALRELKIIDEARFWKAQSQSVSKCLLGLEGQPLTDSSRPGKFKNYYHCGATINLLAEAALRASGSKDDLFSFWRRVFVVNANGTYDDKAFLKVLKETAGSEPTVLLVNQIVNGPTENIEAPLRSEFDRLRLQVLTPTPTMIGIQASSSDSCRRKVVTLDCGASARMGGRESTRSKSKGSASR